MYYLYIFKNKRDQTTYIGYTNDPKRRIKEHKGKKPELIYYEAYKDKRDAEVREKKLKQRGQAVRWLKNRIKFSLNSQP